MLTKDLVQQAVPANLKTSITQELVDLVNNIASDPIVAENVRENFISYTSVLKDGRFKTEDYIHAVTYVSYKLMGKSNKEAYASAFPNRYAALVAKGTTEKDISAYVAAYNRGKLVNLILEQTLVPTWVLNQGIYQQAINTQAELMMTANSEKVRSDAANSILTHLKKPDAAGPLIALEINESSGMNELKQALQAMADKQLQAIEAGVSLKTVTETPLIEASAGEVTESGIS
jgi:hypothetical protein